MQLEKALTNFVTNLRKSIPGAGIVLYKETKNGLEIQPGMPANKKLTDRQLAQCKTIAKSLSKSELKISISTGKKGAAWEGTSEEHQPWSKAQLECENIKNRISSSKDSVQLLELLPQLSKCYFSMHKFDLAQACLERLEESCESHKSCCDSANLAAILYFAAHDYVDLQRYDDARHVAEKARKYGHGDHSMKILMDRISKAEKWAAAERKQLEKAWK